MRSLPRLLPERTWCLPARERRDAAHVRALLVVISATIGVFLVFLVENLREARIFTPDLVHSLVSQVIDSPLIWMRIQGMTLDGLISPFTEFMMMGYSALGLWDLVGLLMSGASRVDALLALRLATVGLNLAGAPLLYLAARRAGLRAWPAAFVAALYLFNPVLSWRISWDLCGWQGTMLIGAYLCLQRRRYWAACVLWFIAAGGHPLATWGVTLWCAVEWRVGVNAGRESRVLRAATCWFAAHALALFTVMFVLPQLSATFSGHTRASMLADPTRIRGIPAHALQILFFLGCFWFLPLKRARWFLFMVADGLYYLFTGIDHGLNPSTVGMLSIATLEGSARVMPAWERLPAPARAALGSLMALAVLAVSGGWTDRNQLRRFVAGQAWDGDWIADVRALADQTPGPPSVCVVQPPLYPIMEEACGLTVPWHDPTVGLLPAGARRVYALHLGLFDERRYASRLNAQDRERAAELCRRVRGGELRVLAEVSDALLLGARGGEAVTPSGALDRLCELVRAGASDRGVLEHALE